MPVPAGMPDTVEPGAAVTYRVRAMNSTVAALAELQIDLALDPDVDAPVSFPLPATSIGGSPVAVSAVYDPDRHVLRFNIAGSVVEVYSAKGFRGDQTVKVAAGIKNAAGYRLREASQHTVAFEALKPQVRFAGKGVILPTSTGLTVPIETVNLRAVTVEAMRIPDAVMPQFLQTNDKVGYVVIDVDAEYSDLALEKLQHVNGTIRSRVLF